MAHSPPIIELLVYADGRVTLACDGDVYSFPSLGCTEEDVDEDMLREVMAQLDAIGERFCEESLHDAWTTTQKPS